MPLSPSIYVVLLVCIGLLLLSVGLLLAALHRAEKREAWWRAEEVRLMLWTCAKDGPPTLLYMDWWATGWRDRALGREMPPMPNVPCGHGANAPTAETIRPGQTLEIAQAAYERGYSASRDRYGYFCN